MANIRATNFLFDSVALDAPKNDIETLTFSKMQKKQEKKVCPLQGLNPGPLGQKSSALPTELLG